MTHKKSDVITFKADADLLEAMKGIENRSGFIRAAILAALDNTCPLCKGTGKLTASQQKHWNHFSKSHHMETCENCNALIISCPNNPKKLDENKEVHQK